MQFFLTWVWAAIPVWIAVQTPYGAGDYVWVPVVAFSGLAAPIGFWAAAAIKHPVWKMVGVFVGLIAAVWNIATAVGSSAEHRQVRAEPDKVRIEQRESLLRRDAQLVEKIAKLGWRLNGDTSVSIGGKIGALQTRPHYIRTNGCEDLRARDFEGVCAKLVEERARLKEAGAVETFEEEREQIRKDLLKIAAPQSADMQVDTIRRLLSYFMDADAAAISALLSGLGPLVCELIGTILPAVISQWFREQNESGTGEGGEGQGGSSSHPPRILPRNLENSLSGAVEDDPPILPASSPEGGFGLWCGEHVEDGGEDALQARQLFLHCRNFCQKKEVPAPSEREFSSLMLARGYHKQKLRGIMHYSGIRLKSITLKVVK